MWPNPQEIADLVTFTVEILNGKLHFLCSDGDSELFFSQSLAKTYLFDEYCENLMKLIVLEPSL